MEEENGRGEYADIHPGGEQRRAVYEKTGGKQVPGEYSQLFEPVYLAGTAAPSSEIAARDMSIGDFSGFSYCSSSEHDNDHSWGQSFYSADQNYYVKNYDNQIRAVRAF